MKFRKSYLLLVLAVPCFTAWLGYERERQWIETGRHAAPLASKLRRMFVRPEASIARLDELRRAGGRRGLSPQDKGECWRIVRGLNEEQVKACLADIPESSFSQRDQEVWMMLNTRWTQLDPEEVGRLVRGDFGRHDVTLRMYARMQVLLTEWLKNDPDAALRWAGSEKSKIPALAIHLAGRRFVLDDPSTAIGKAEKQAPFVLPGVMEALAGRAGDGAEARQQFFELTRDRHGDADWIRAAGLAASNWAMTDPNGALNSAERYGMSDEEFGSFRAAAVEVISWSEPAKALDWLMQNGAEPDSHEVSSTYETFVRENSEQAAVWALNNHRSDLLEASINEQVRQALGWGSDRPEQLLQSMAAQYQAWKNLQPEAAAQWAGRLPSSFLNKLTSSSNGTH